MIGSTTKQCRRVPVDRPVCWGVSTQFLNLVALAEIKQSFEFDVMLRVEG
jgi:hypothetical protein